MRSVRKEDTSAVSEVFASFRNDILIYPANKIGSQYIDDLRMYMLDGAIQDVAQQINSIYHTMESGERNLSVRERLAAHPVEVNVKKNPECPDPNENLNTYKIAS